MEDISKFVDFGTRKKMSKEWHKSVIETLTDDQEQGLWLKFKEWLQTDSGEQAIIDSGGHMNDTLSPLRCADAFAIAGRSFIAGWLLAKEDLVDFLTED